MLRIHEIKLNLDEDPSCLPDRVRRKLGMPKLVFQQFLISKESIDARDKQQIRRVYSIDFSVAEEEALLTKGKKAGVELSPDLTYRFAARSPAAALSADLGLRPVIIGFGPAGMFAGLILAQMGVKPLILERGKRVEQRIVDVDRFWQEGILDPESNVQFGEGGAGTFSDGKLYTQTRDPRLKKVLTELVEAGGDPSLLYLQKAHIGTDVLRSIVVRIREKIIELGGELRFESRCTGLSIEGGRLSGVQVNDQEWIPTDAAVLAVGHSARDTFRMLHGTGIRLEQKPFSMGVRIEHPQDLIDLSQYGSLNHKEQLGAAEYKLSHRCQDGRGVYTFCMCPGGYVVAAASQEGGVVTNGMSYQARCGENANSGLLADVRPEDYDPAGHSPGGIPDPLAGISYQEKYERLAYLAGGSNYRAPAQRVGSFLNPELAETEDGQNSSAEPCKGQPEPTYQPGVCYTKLETCLPDFVVQALREALPHLGRKLKGFDAPEAVMTGVETRSSSPVRISRDSTMQSSLPGLYPAGEGAGFAGGIVSAAVDGIRIAEAILTRAGATESNKEV